MSQGSKKPDSDNLDTVWARKKVASLMDKLHTGEHTIEQTKPLVTALGIKHHILTKYTSFVAVDKTPSRPENTAAKNKNVPNLTPKGTTMPVPQTATPAALLSFLGALLMLMSVINRKFSLTLISDTTRLLKNRLYRASRQLGKQV